MNDNRESLGGCHLQLSAKCSLLCIEAGRRPGKVETGFPDGNGSQNADRPLQF
jgi:hypothetical protein